MNDAGRYGYAVGRLSVRKSRALAGAVEERLLAADTVQVAVAALDGTPFGRPLAALGAQPDARAMQAAISEVVADAYRFTAQAGLPAEVQRYFHLRHDFENARAVVKARIVGADARHFTSDLGSSTAEAVVAALAAWPEVGAGLPAHLQRPLRALAATLARGARSAAVVPAQGGFPGQPSRHSADSLEAVDAAFDRAMHQALTAAALATGNQYLIALSKLEVDLANLKQLIRRSRAMGRPAHRAVAAIPGGNVSPRAILNSSAETTEDLVRLLAAQGPLRGADVQRLLSPVTLDQELSRIRARHTAAGERMDVGLEPLVAYVARTESEAQLVRSALISIGAGLVPEDVVRAAGQPAGASTPTTTTPDTPTPRDATRRATHRIAVLGDAASVAVLTAVGVVGFSAASSEEARDAWPQIISGGFAAVFITEPFAAPLHDQIDLLASAATPAVTIIPSLGSPGGMGAAKLARAVERALGSAVGAGTLTGATQRTTPPQRTEQ